LAGTPRQGVRVGADADASAKRPCRGWEGAGCLSNWFFAVFGGIACGLGATEAKRRLVRPCHPASMTKSAAEGERAIAP
jgi:hypothetical protein